MTFISHCHHSHHLSAFQLIVCPVFFVNSAAKIGYTFIRVSPQDSVTRGGRPPPLPAHPINDTATGMRAWLLKIVWKLQIAETYKHIDTGVIFGRFKSVLRCQSTSLESTPCISSSHGLCRKRHLKTLLFTAAYGVTDNQPLLT